MTNRDEMVRHDTRLLELHHEAYRAMDAVTEAEQRALSAVSVGRRDHDDRVTIYEGDYGSRYGTLADLAVGDVFWQAKTFTRGEGNRHRVKTESGHRPATIDDATDIPDKQWEALTEARQNVALATRAIVNHEDNYTGWNRYFLVVSSAGHIHRSTGCSTCRPTTRFHLVVKLSGLDDDAAVAELGDHLCTVCFPDAPVKGRVTKLTKAAAKRLIEALNA